MKIPCSSLVTWISLRCELGFGPCEKNSSYGNLPMSGLADAGARELILLPTRMLISVHTGLGPLLVNVNSILSDSLPSILTSIFPTATASDTNVSHVGHTYAKRDELSETERIVFGCLIPVLVILSGVFAGLTLGYMSLDETQLNVLSISGTP